MSEQGKLSREYKVLAQQLEDVKRDNWELSDEIIEGYLIGKEKGRDELVSSVIKYYIDILNRVQDSVETVHNRIKENDVETVRAFMKIMAFNFEVVFVINESDFSNMTKKRACYQIAKEESCKINNSELLATYIFTSDENLDIDRLKSTGYNASFG